MGQKPHADRRAHQGVVEGEPPPGPQPASELSHRRVLVLKRAAHAVLSHSWEHRSCSRCGASMQADCVARLCCAGSRFSATSAAGRQAGEGRLPGAASLLPATHVSFCSLCRMHQTAVQQCRSHIYLQVRHAVGAQDQVEGGRRELRRLGIPHQELDARAACRLVGLLAACLRREGKPWRGCEPESGKVSLSPAGDVHATASHLSTL